MNPDKQWVDEQLAKLDEISARAATLRVGDRVRSLRTMDGDSTFSMIRIDWRGVVVGVPEPPVDQEARLVLWDGQSTPVVVYAEDIEVISVVEQISELEDGSP